MSDYNDLLKGAYDIHIHSAPSIFNRSQTDWELLEDATKALMGGIVLKSHESSTAERAFLLNEKTAGNVEVFGGIVLNQYVGGINPWSVEASLMMGGKFVWFPTIATDQHLAYFKNKDTKLFNGKPTNNSKAIYIQENGQIKEDVVQILQLIKKYNAVLATGHLSLEDQHVLVAKAIEVGVTKIVIQHADMGISRIPIEDQLYFAKQGCMIEKCYLACTSDFNDLTVKEMLDTILYIGPESCVVGTDFGQAHNIPPIKALETFVEKLLNVGLNADCIDMIIRQNPQSLIS